MIDWIGPSDDAALPTKRVLAVGLVALALVAAGCLGGGGGGDTTTVATTDATTTEETTTEAATTAEETTTEEATTTGATATGEATAGAATTGAATNGSGNTTLSITVENESGEPVGNATVQVADQEGGVLEGVFGGDDATDPGAVGPDGGVTVTLPNGEYNVTAQAEGYIPAVAQVEANGTDANITLTLAEAAALTPTTDELQGNETAVPTLPGNQTTIPPRPAANRTTVSFEEEAYTLNVTVEDGSGAPVGNATVQVADEGGPLSGLFGADRNAGAVNAEGVVSVELTNGTYTVSAEADGFGETQRDVEINGSATNVTVTLNGTTTTGR